MLLKVMSVSLDLPIVDTNKLRTEFIGNNICGTPEAIEKLNEGKRNLLHENQYIYLKHL